MVKVMLFNVTFNKISIISWQSVLLAEDTGVPEKKTPVASPTLYRWLVKVVTRARVRFQIRIFFITSLLRHYF